MNGSPFGKKKKKLKLFYLFIFVLNIYLSYLFLGFPNRKK